MSADEDAMHQRERERDQARRALDILNSPKNRGAAFILKMVPTNDDLHMQELGKVLMTFLATGQMEIVLNQARDWAATELDLAEVHLRDAARKFADSEPDIIHNSKGFRP